MQFSLQVTKVMTRQYKVQIYQDVFPLSSTYTTSPLQLDGEGNRGEREIFLCLEKVFCFIPFLRALTALLRMRVLSPSFMKDWNAASHLCLWQLSEVSNNTCNSLSTKHNKTSTHWIKTNGSSLQHRWAMKDWKLCMSSFYPCSNTRNRALEKKKKRDNFVH